MNKEKKQMIAVIALAVMILAIGAFQFMGGSAEEPKKEEPKKAATAEEKKPTPEEATKSAIKNPEFANLLPERDPFEESAFVEEARKAAATEEEAKKKPVAETKPNSGKGSKIPKPKLPPLKGDLGNSLAPMPVEAPKFEYSLIGILWGAHPSAIFVDKAGNQSMVDIGQPVGSSASVISITRNSVKVKFNAEILVLRVGVNPSAK